MPKYNTISDFKTYYRDTVFKTAWYQHKDGYINRSMEKIYRVKRQTHTYMSNQLSMEEMKSLVNEESFQKVALEYSEIHTQKMDFYPPYLKRKSKWIISLNTKLKAIELLEEKLNKIFVV